MNDDQLSQILDTISKERVSANMDLWHSIQEKLSDPPTKLHQFRRQRARWLLVAALVIMATSAMAVLAQSGNGNRSFDAGLNAASEQGLVTYFNDIKTDGDMSVMLEYAYADAHRLSISYNTEMQITEDDLGRIYFTSTLEDANGTILSPIFGGGGGGGGGGGNPDDAGTETPATFIISSGHFDSFDVFSTDLGEELSLSLVVTAKRSSAPLAGPQTAHAEDDETVGEVQFEFAVPVYGGLQHGTAQSQMANNIEMILQDVSVTISMTRIVLCFDAPPPPTSQLDWSVRPELAIDGVEVDGASFWSTIPQTDATYLYPENCKIYFLTDSLLDREGDWSLTIPYLYAPNPVSQAVIEERLQEEFDIAIIQYADGGMGFEENGNIDIGTAMDIIHMDNEDRVDGPWVFTFTLKE